VSWRATYPPALEGRFLRPPAPRLDEAIAIARERIPALEYEPSEDGPVLRMPRAFRKHRARELWETFVTRGLLPESWLEDPRRASNEVLVAARQRVERAGIDDGDQGSPGVGELRRSR